MPPARPNKPARVPLMSRLRKLVPNRGSVAYLCVGASPVLVGVGVSLEMGVGWGLVAAGPCAFVVGWLLGAE